MNQPRNSDMQDQIDSTKVHQPLLAKPRNQATDSNPKIVDLCKDMHLWEATVYQESQLAK